MQALIARRKENKIFFVAIKDPSVQSLSLLIGLMSASFTQFK